LTDARRTEELLAAFERRSRRARPFIIIGLIIVVVSLAASAIYLNRLLQQERAASAVAYRRAEIIMTQRDLARRTVETSTTTLDQVRGALRRGDIALAQQLLDIATSEVRDATRRPTGVEARPADTTPVQIDQQRRERPQLVFIQFAGSIPRERIVALNRALRAAGWRTQGASGERTPAALGVNEVRYNPADGSEAAEALANAVNQAGIGNRRVEVQPVGIIGRGTLEVWISNAEADAP
jgi:hypothetical protein